MVFYWFPVMPVIFLIQYFILRKKAEGLLGTCKIILYMDSTSLGCFEALSCTHHKIRDLQKVTIVPGRAIFFMFNFQLVVVNAQGFIISNGNLQTDLIAENHRFTGS